MGMTKKLSPSFIVLMISEIRSTVSVCESAMNGLLSEQFLLADGGYEFLQVERLEVCNVAEITVV